MNLFIETPQRAVERLEREQRLERGAVSARNVGRGSTGFPSATVAPFDLDEPESVASNRSVDRPLPGQPYSVAQESYRRELAFDRKRARKRGFAAVLKTVLFALLLPVVLVAVFVAAYALACIANGASPQELLELLAALLERMGGFAAGALAAS